ncbi:transcriptional regulator [Planococcus antarcticus DSM 14505]|uniref:Transcriptional regulator n=1 Tax=Planococcus antarcticus DSM 14505 TaxID=1185653 RepID=A0AA87LSF0_9BACL|nr:PadR family transcriptional regulator [Planococcus antarcticus]EIM04962.1 transcriptional regulator [Planococcus antarcticus DSM 14505]
MSEGGISRDLIRGNIDTIILRVLSEGDNYGYEIIKEIFKSSSGNYELKETSLYSSLKRLQVQKLIEAYWGDESQGGRRKYYKITELGVETFEKNLKAWRTAKVLIDQLIEVRGDENE